MSIHGDPRRESGQTAAREPGPRVRETPPYRDFWTVAQLAGLALLAAGVAVLVAFALTVGGR